MEVIQKSVRAIFGQGDKSPSVKELNIYPIKSCAEVQVDSATVTPRGFKNDRVFQVVSKVDGAWNYCTPRDKTFEKLFHIKPTFADGNDSLQLSSIHTDENMSVISVEMKDGASTSSLTAATMGGSEQPLNDYGDDVASWLKGAAGVDTDLRLVGIGKENHGFKRCVEVNPDQGEVLPTTASPIPVSLADEAPFLLTTQESLADLNRRLKSAGKGTIDMRRFRPNIVISGLKPWEEDSLKRIKIGGVEFHVWQRCGRCTMTTIDRDTLKRCGEPLSTLSTFRERANGQRNFGVHLIPISETIDPDDGKNKVSVGNEVEILEYNEARREEWIRLFGTT